MTDNTESEFEHDTQVENIVTEAVPVSEIATDVGDIPPDFGEPGMVDFPDPAWDDIDDDGTEEPGEGEPKDEDDGEEPEEPVEEEDEEEGEHVAPAMMEEDELPEPEEEEEAVNMEGEQP